jgi:hypothetical protein
MPMKLAVWVTALFSLLLLAPAAGAQPLNDRRNEIVIGSASPASAVSERQCIEVEIGGDKSEPLDCLNRKLKQQVDRVMPSFSAVPIDAGSQDIRVGVFNRSALQQQYGSNFGVSVIPQRPAAPNFTNSLGGRR